MIDLKHHQLIDFKLARSEFFLMQKFVDLNLKKHPYEHCSSWVSYYQRGSKKPTVSFSFQAHIQMNLLRGRFHYEKTSRICTPLSAHALCLYTK